MTASQLHINIAYFKRYVNTFVLNLLNETVHILLTPTRTQVNIDLTIPFAIIYDKIKWNLSTLNFIWNANKICPHNTFFSEKSNRIQMPFVFASEREWERENSIFLNSVQFVEVNQIINEIKSRHYARARKRVHVEGRWEKHAATQWK